MSPAQRSSPPAHIDVATELQNALRLPRSDPQVAEWLFSGQHAPFHLNYDILPLSAFAEASAYVSSQSFDLLQNFTHTSPPPLTAVSSTTLFVQALSTDHVILGYSFTAIISPNPLIQERVPFHHLRLGRFAYSPELNLVNLCINMAPGNDALLCVHRPSHHSRNRYFFGIPRISSQHCQLPSKLHSAFVCKNEAPSTRPYSPRISPILPTSSQPVADHHYGHLINPHNEQHLIKGPSDYAHGVWEGNSIQQLPRCVLEELDQSFCFNQRQKARSQDLYHQSSTSWLSRRDIRIMKRSFHKPPISKSKSSVLFDMSSVSLSRSPKPMRSEEEKTPKPQQPPIPDPTMSDDDFSWCVTPEDDDTLSEGSHGGGLDSDDEHLNYRKPQDRKRRSFSTETVVSLFEGTFEVPNAVRVFFDERTSAMSRSETYRATSKTTPLRADNLTRFRKTAAQIYYDTLLWKSGLSRGVAQPDTSWLFKADPLVSKVGLSQCRNTPFPGPAIKQLSLSYKPRSPSEVEEGSFPESG
ncbi:unnamed protein product [Agarophyton chilense]